MRAGAYSWKSSAKAIDRLKTTSSEIRAVARTDPIAAAEGVIALAQRIWPAFEHIDTSSGALGNAVRRTLEELLPVLIKAPADEKIRAKWLEQLREAILDDGVDYLAPIADRFGQIAAFPALMNLHADRDLDMIQAAWSDHARFSHVTTATLTLSCLLEAGRYDELLVLLELKTSRLWFDQKFGAEALLRQGREDEALAYAESLLKDDRRQWGYQDIAQFCETILVRQGREEAAYRRFGLLTAAGNTYLAMWRGLVKRYPDLDARMILVDLIESHGSKGKWFAAAKTAKYFDIALECAAHPDAAPATLIRAARDFAITEPAFAAQVGLQAIGHLLAGRGYEPSPLDIDEAVTNVMAAAERIGQGDRLLRELQRLSANAATNVLMSARLKSRIADIERGDG
ncbi:hypothetical protein [Pseudorhodobacter aquimaris]|uniref:hypothetical protein n=1 Tax=Pseudorhodobacter aquimaris TaxID=687412 RepID=UPI001E396613|nr:hypothetical protein [Pseudorhodobacter aquimaris]